MTAAKADTNPLREALEQARSVLMEECLPWVRHSGPRQGTTHGKIDDVVAVIDAALASEPVAGTDALPQNGKVSIALRDKFIAALSAADRSWDSPNHLTRRYLEHVADCLMASDLSAPPAPAGREEIAGLLKSRGFTSRDGTYLQGATADVIDAILSAVSPQGRGVSHEERIEQIAAEVTEEVRAEIEARERVAAETTISPGTNLDLIRLLLRSIDNANAALREYQATPPVPGAADRAAVIDGDEMDDFIRAVLADNNPRSDEPYATVAKWIRLIRLAYPVPEKGSTHPRAQRGVGS